MKSLLRLIPCRFSLACVLWAAPLLGAVADSAVDEVAAAAPTAGAITAEALVAGALDLVRGRTSYAELTMVIHRPEWERTSSLVSWTRGREDALI
ncbi:MAG TPA: hypothetical protein VIS76_12735, partial [Pseudomonadales bacterium]